MRGGVGGTVVSGEHQRIAAKDSQGTGTLISTECPEAAQQAPFYEVEWNTSNRQVALLIWLVQQANVV